MREDIKEQLIVGSCIPDETRIGECAFRPFNDEASLLGAIKSLYKILLYRMDKEDREDFFDEIKFKVKDMAFFKVYHVNIGGIKFESDMYPAGTPVYFSEAERKFNELLSFAKERSLKRKSKASLKADLHDRANLAILINKKPSRHKQLGFLCKLSAFNT